jgi:DNA polymerase
MNASLDARQRAMLAEMGVRVWSPQTTTEPAASPAEVKKTPQVVLAPSPEIKRAPAVALAPAPEVKQAPGVVVSPLPEGLAHIDWAGLQAAAAQCQACGLCNGRHLSLFASGSVTPGAHTDWLIVGDAPTDAEDQAGEAFVGEEGVLLDAMLQAMGLSRRTAVATKASLVITSAVKCRPPENRNPTAEEIKQCSVYLQRQIALLQPKVILALGRLAAQALLHDSLGEAALQPLGKLRGQVHQAHGRPVVVSYHPAYLLRSPSDKAKAWADLILAMQQVQPTPA